MQKSPPCQTKGNRNEKKRTLLIIISAVIVSLAIGYIYTCTFYLHNSKGHIKFDNKDYILNRNYWFDAENCPFDFQFAGYILGMYGPVDTYKLQTGGFDCLCAFPADPLYENIFIADEPDLLKCEFSEIRLGNPVGDRSITFKDVEDISEYLEEIEPPDIGVCECGSVLFYFSSDLEGLCKRQDMYIKNDTYYIEISGKYCRFILDGASRGV